MDTNYQRYEEKYGPIPWYKVIGFAVLVTCAMCVIFVSEVYEAWTKDED